jgi:MYXO-CTERM domain-containing protein
MRNTMLGIALATLSSLSAPALACGGGFGGEVRLDPAQTIVITERDGEEGYTFQPHFCGKASAFGLILPVPAALTSNPALADVNLYDQLAAVSAPTVETVEVCASNGFVLGGSANAVDSASGSTSGGTYVIDQGKVGIFTWELLKADTSRSFTDWLNANAFPYPASAASAFDHYVQSGWYFVAFRVTASQTDPTVGYQICGDFGPISLSFPTPQAIIPARMATAGDTQSLFFWRVFTIAAHQMTVSSGTSSGQASSQQQFAGKLQDEDLANRPAAGSIAKPGEWLTELNISFYGPTLKDDITLASTTSDQAFRRHLYVEKEVDCGVFGCSVSHGKSDGGWLAAAFAALAGIGIVTSLRHKHRRRTSARLRRAD